MLKDEMPIERLVILSDCTDVAINEIRGALLNKLKRSNVNIEPIVAIKPFSVINASFLLRLVAEAYPQNTCFFVICNALKKRPERLVGKTKKKNFVFIGANTGAFGWLAADFGIKEVFELYDPGFFPFGGKYVHTPVIASILNGNKINTLGKKFPEKKIKKSDIVNGTVVHIDNFGLIKIFGKISKKLIPKQKILIKTNRGHEFKAIFDDRMMNNPDNAWVLYRGSSLSGLPELGKVRANGAAELGITEGDRIDFIF